MRGVKELFQLSDAVKRHLLVVERKYLVTCLVHDKFEKMFCDVFQKDASPMEMSR